jgi:hypothetical protein
MNSILYQILDEVYDESNHELIGKYRDQPLIYAASDIGPDAHIAYSIGVDLGKILVTDLAPLFRYLGALRGEDVPDTRIFLARCAPGWTDGCEHNTGAVRDPCVITFCPKFAELPTTLKEIDPSDANIDSFHWSKPGAACHELTHSTSGWSKLYHF